MVKLDSSWEGISVSHGTMRDIDLIPSFLSVLELVEYPGISAYRIEWDEIEKSRKQDGHNYWCICKYCDSSYLMEDVWDALMEIAPDGCYFGAHPGDGSDYGFWKEEDIDDEYDLETELVYSDRDA